MQLINKNFDSFFYFLRLYIIVELLKGKDMETITPQKSTEILEDNDIIELFWNKNEKAIPATDAKYGKYLYTIAYNIVHDKLDCDECLNDTYLGTWNRIPPVRPTAFQVFLSKIMRNIAVDKYRKNIANKRVPSELTVSLDELDDCIDYTFDIDEEIFAKELGSILSEFLRGIPKKSATMFICRYYYSDSIESIADMFKISKPTVFRTLAALRKQLAEKLAERGYTYGQKQ